MDEVSSGRGLRLNRRVVRRISGGARSRGRDAVTPVHRGGAGLVAVHRGRATSRGGASMQSEGAVAAVDETMIERGVGLAAGPDGVAQH
jgi:hypothetical protein